MISEQSVTKKLDQYTIFIADDPFTVVSEDQISPTTHWTKKFIALL